MVSIKKATEMDFERVLPCLRRFEENGEANPDHIWKRLFTRYWQSNSDHCGYMLLDGENVKGYLGLLYSTRLIRGKIERFCNLTTWIVDEEVRNRSLLLLVEALKQRQVTFTCFTANPMTAALVFRKMGFEEFEVRQRVFLAVPGLPSTGLKSVETDKDMISERLEGEELRIFEDHRDFKCKHVYFEEKNGPVYTIFTMVKKKRLPFAELQHVNDRQRFSESLRGHLLRMCIKLGVAGLIIDERFLTAPVEKGFSYRPGRNVFFRPGSANVLKEDIDYLYSELVALHWH